jgi:hypothetical protein
MHIFYFLFDIVLMPKKEELLGGNKKGPAGPHSFIAAISFS